MNLFVAGVFMGSPAMNFVTAELVRDDGPAVTFADHRLPLLAAVVESRPGLDRYFGREVILGIGPAEFEDASLADPDWARMQVTANVTEELGSEIHVIFTLDAVPVHHPSISDAVAADGDADEAAAVLAGGKSLWTARVASRSRVVRAAFRAGGAHREPAVLRPRERAGDWPPGLVRRLTGRGLVVSGRPATGR